MLRLNPTIKAYLEKGMKLEDKKLHAVKNSRIILNEEVKKHMVRYEHKVL